MLCLVWRAAQQKLTGHMAKSADIMKMMNKLVKVAEVGEVMQQMQQEMCKVRALSPNGAAFADPLPTNTRVEPPLGPAHRLV